MRRISSNRLVPGAIVALALMLASVALARRIEIPIPAGCTYESKPQPYYNRGEVHREYFRNKCSIFCTKLAPGRYTYQIPLLPQYTGSYTLNPAKAELMYFPTFYGREEGKRVIIK